MGPRGGLATNDVIVKCFHCDISEFDMELFALVLGSCEGQQILECLAILVAIRGWIPTCQKRVQLAPVIRGDNVGALTLVLKMRPKTDKMAIIAREMALCLVIFSFYQQSITLPEYRTS